MRVLVVDRSSGFRDLVRRAVTESGHGEIVGHVARAEEATSAVAEHRPDVVLMARSLPDHDGVWATRQIKVLFPHVDVVALTAAGDGAAGEAFMAAGATARFDKEDLPGVLRWLAEERPPP
ncbi:MAG TPA: response regulator [Thermoleophilaceae bacterium]|nr:response regulator [Thermoleophilaceae bacterium]